MKVKQLFTFLLLTFGFFACQNSIEQQSEESQTIVKTAKIDTKIEKAPVISNTGIEQLIVEHYPERNNTSLGKCFCGEGKNDFCYTLEIAHKYDFQDEANKIIIILGATIGGENCTRDEGTSHAATGWVDAIVLEYKEFAWSVLSVSKKIGGGWGWGDWGSIGRIQYFAKNSPVIGIETGFTGQGVTNGAIDLIGMVNNKMQNIGTLQNYTDNSGQAFDETKAECFCIEFDFEDNGEKFYDLIASKKDCKKDMQTAEGCAGKTLKKTIVKFNGKKYVLGKDFELW